MTFLFPDGRAAQIIHGNAMDGVLFYYIQPDSKQPLIYFKLIYLFNGFMVQ